MVLEAIAVLQNPTKISENEKFKEICTIIDTVSLQRKCLANIPINQSRHSNENAGIYKTIVSQGLSKITVSNRLGLLLSSDKKPLLFNLKINQNAINATVNRGMQLTSLGSTQAKIGCLLTENFDDDILLAISFEEKLYVWMIGSVGLRQTFAGTNKNSDDEKNRKIDFKKTENTENSDAELIAILSHHSQNICQLKMTKNQHFLITAGADGYLNIYSTFEIFDKGNHCQPLRQLKVNNLSITGLEFINLNPKFLRTVVTGTDCCLRLWEIDLFADKSDQLDRKTNDDGAKAKSKARRFGVISNEILKYDFQSQIEHLKMDSNMYFAYIILSSNRCLVKKVGIKALQRENDNNSTSKKMKLVQNNSENDQVSSDSPIQNFKNSTVSRILKLEITSDNSRLITLDNDCSSLHPVSNVANNGTIKIWCCNQLYIVKTIACNNCLDFALINDIPNKWFAIDSENEKKYLVQGRKLGDEQSRHFKMPKFLSKTLNVS